MRKKTLLAIIYLCVTGTLIAKEPLLAMLDNTFSNEVQKFGVGNYTFECKPYGILTLEKLYSAAKEGSSCQTAIDEFYTKKPKLKYYSDMILERKQRYHIEIKDTECIIYAKGQVTLSELLLNEGLAIKRPTLKDEEFDEYFTLAQRKAKIEKKGLWGEKIFSSCIEELYK
ncbi:hypothetical protein [Sulfurimonas sp.]|uniref:hypothetical protein n=1 Tax=Sulfurimonas sp. TaxID=2022749 RepID=UPI00356B38C4